jgi:hypothetical protein
VLIFFQSICFYNLFLFFKKKNTFCLCIPKAFGLLLLLFLIFPKKNILLKCQLLQHIVRRIVKLSIKYSRPFESLQLGSRLQRASGLRKQMAENIFPVCFVFEQARRISCLDFSKCKCHTD